MEEFEETGKVLGDKISLLADICRASKEIVAFTGAGISTSAGIPDFRGPQGIWTLSEKEENEKAEGKLQTRQASKPDGQDLSKSLAAFEPTKGHMALVALQQAGKLSGVISQNVDGLHARSGIAQERLIELHGNCFVELCFKCGLQFTRDFDTCTAGQAFAGRCPECCKNGKRNCHCTPRLCPRCGRHLKDSLVNFREMLPKDEYERAVNLSKRADLMLCLGSSMNVQPASQLPELLKDRPNARLVLVNKQKTDLDDKCDLRIFASIDNVLCGLLAHLKIAPLAFLPSRSTLLPTSPQRERELARQCPEAKDGKHVWPAQPAAADRCAACKRDCARWCELCGQCWLCAGTSSPQLNGQHAAAQPVTIQAQDTGGSAEERQGQNDRRARSRGRGDNAAKGGETQGQQRSEEVARTWFNAAQGKYVTRTESLNSEESLITQLKIPWTFIWASLAAVVAWEGILSVITTYDVPSRPEE
eukprot:g18251.t1